MKLSEAGSPFKCDECSERDKDNRNCFNRKGLSEGAIAVESYTDEIAGEHRELNAQKVFSLGTLRLYECPLSYLTQDTREITRLVYLCEDKGLMLHEGGIGNQPSWFIEAMEVFRAEKLKAINDLRKK
jgi:hypothetical protein